jgi:ABC-type Na+ efflux pump permease subunit
MKEKFRGWTTVFSFTFKQATKGKGYKAVSIGISLLLIGFIVLINILAAKPDEAKETKPSPIEQVLVLDQSGLEPIDFRALNPELSEDRFQNVSFLPAKSNNRKEVIQAAAAASPKAIAVIISSGDAGYKLEAIIPDGSEITKKQANALLTVMTAAFETHKVLQAGISQEQLYSALTPVVTSYAEVGEDTNEIVFAVKLIVPMLFGLMLYFMLQFYGQTISKSVSTEKTSKLMETLLTSVHPYALVAGKVLAMTSMALLQFISWIVSVVIGLYGGNAIAHAIYPEYQNSVVAFIDLLKNNIGESAMTLPAILLAILFFSISFLFYAVIAGLAGCMVSKPEDAASTQSLFLFPIIIGWLVTYFPLLSGNKGLLNVAQYIPFTAPFCVPSNLITGTMGLLEGIIAFGLILLFTLLIIILSGRLYKGLILYNGQKVDLKLIGNILKSK